MGVATVRQMSNRQMTIDHECNKVFFGNMVLDIMTLSTIVTLSIIDLIVTFDISVKLAPQHNDIQPKCRISNIQHNCHTQHNSCDIRHEH